MKKEDIVSYILLTAILTFTLQYTVGNTNSSTELDRACQSGMLFYVTKYKEELDIFEKRKRIEFIAEKCGKYSKGVK